MVPPYLVSQPPIPDAYNHELALEIGRFSPAERQTLREVQEYGIEIPLVMAGQDLINSLRVHISNFRAKLNEPLIKTPWQFWNDSVTNDSIIDRISEGALYKASSFCRSSLFSGLNKLEANMLELDTLQTQLESIRRKPSVKARGMKQNLQKQIDSLSLQIKQQVYPKIEDQLSKHLKSNYRSKKNDTSILQRTSS